jgi:hypothetical protein
MTMSPATANDQYWPCGGGSTRYGSHFPVVQPKQPLHVLVLRILEKKVKERRLSE